MGRGGEFIIKVSPATPERWMLCLFFVVSRSAVVIGDRGLQVGAAGGTKKREQITRDTTVCVKSNIFDSRVTYPTSPDKSS